jgi:small subunit ribosomal protein S6
VLAFGKEMYIFRRPNSNRNIIMPQYEITYIARQEIAENDVEKLTGEFSKLLETGGGKIIKTEYWGLRNFSYEMNKSKRGHYTLIGVDAPAPAVKELERQMRLHENVMRYLTIAVEKVSRDPSPIISNDNSDDDFELKIEAQ